MPFRLPALPSWLISSASRLRRDRRGATAVLFAVSGTALLGAVAMFTDGGLLYLTQRRVQSAADAAAIAAASAAESRSRDAALAAASEVASLNGFASSTGTQVVARNPPSRGPFQNDPSAYEVTITRQQPMSLAAALFGIGDKEVVGQAVAVLKGRMQVCLLALNGNVTVQSYGNFEARGCAIGANATGSRSVQIAHAGSFAAQGVLTAGNCEGCTNPNVKLTEGYQEQAPPISNPYSRLDKLVPPDPPCTTSAVKTFNATTRMPRYEQSRTAFCNGAYAVGNDGAIVLDAGTYVFRNASLSFGGTPEVRCNGCTFIMIGTGSGTAASFTVANLNRFLCDNCSIVLLGSRPGQVKFSSVSTVRLTAPVNNAYDPALNGMIISRANAGPSGSSSSPTLELANLNSIDVLGGVYAPNAYTRISNMTAPNPSTCLPIVTGSLEISQLNNFPFDVSGCPARNTAVPQVTVPRLVE